MTTKGITYNEAMEELNTILEEFESEHVDVDHIRDKVKRAIELITLCRQKIEKTELEVRRIVKDFEKDISKKQEEE